MFETHTYGASKTVHLTMQDGNGNTWPICNSASVRIGYSLPRATAAPVTCKTCAKRAA